MVVLVRIEMADIELFKYVGRSLQGKSVINMDLLHWVWPRGAFFEGSRILGKDHDFIANIVIFKLVP
jgi:hypothetical protein